MDNETDTPWTDERESSETCDGWECCRYLERKVEELKSENARLKKAQELVDIDKPIFDVAEYLAVQDKDLTFDAQWWIAWLQRRYLIMLKHGVELTEECDELKRQIAAMKAMED